MRIVCEAPYDFLLSWRMISAFSGRSGAQGGKMSMWWEKKPTTVYLRQAKDDPPTVEIIAEPMPKEARHFHQQMREVLNADLALEPFYRRARRDKTLRPIVNGLIGLKPLRPPDPFQMMVIAVTEQQISLAAARRIRERLAETYGTKVGRITVFPRPRDIAALGVEELRSCGLSQRKAEYIIELAGKVERGEIDPGTWNNMSDDDLIQSLLSHRGVGEWTAEYILVRGLGRPDVVPASDLGVRKVVGMYMAGGRGLSPHEVRDVLEPWSPWRGLLSFYLLAHHRKTLMEIDQAR